MSISTYLLGTAAAAVVALSGVVYWQHGSLASERAVVAAQKVALADAQADAQRLTVVNLAHAKRIDALTKQQKGQTDGKTKVLAAAPEWATTPVPDAVAQWVQRRGAPHRAGIAAAPASP